MSEWQPIETAPKDGTVVDLWVIEKFLRKIDKNKGERVVNARWGTGWRYLPDAREPFDGWAFKEGLYTHEIEYELSGGDRYATHWMPLPEPPK